MSDWKECKLGEVLKFGNGKSRPKSQGCFPVYGGNGILGSSDCTNYEGETIIIGRVGANCGSIYYENNPIWISDNALAAKAKSNNSTKFLYYFLGNLGLNQYAEGSSHPLITQTLLSSIDIDICVNIEEQKTIASVLSSLDDKIDLLHRENKTLEAMAETLFRQWFVEETEKNWEKGTLGEIASFNNGKSRPQESLGGLVPIYGGNGILGYTDQSNHEGISIIIGRVGAYCGSLYIEHRPIWISDNALYAKPNYNVPMNSDKIFDKLSEPDIINGRKTVRKKVHTKWEDENLQPNSKLKSYWSYSKKKNRSAN
ncbi:restriction endonuclease subunit S [Metallumcola ferriviriculae]|uniref:Restriction endonuclease subunit S n=1 Tax=Metallumcola ferriviriculae TaxID=3039180 RepID=A0AAU0UIG8_9FIRM|nr:restriction endonuclease subunit S [Desulfitibacteraceae bacterium MK1]